MAFKFVLGPWRVHNPLIDFYATEGADQTWTKWNRDETGEGTFI